jgi:hypothetical protein
MSFKYIFKDQVNSVQISIVLESHTGRIKEFEGFFSDLEITEDVTNFTLSGNIIFTDTTSMKEYLPIVGGEKLRIKFRTSDEFDWYEKEFIITKIADETVQEGRHKTIRMYFASEELLTNFKQQYSKSFKNKTPSDIVQTIFSEQLKSQKTLTVEGTANSLNFIIPYWNPLQTLRFLMQHSLSAETGDSGYLFYENGEGFNFESISHIFAKKAEKEIVLHQIRNSDNKSSVAFIGTAKYQSYLKTVDLIEDIKKGITGSSVYTFDYGTKGFMKREMEWHQFTNKTGTVLGSNSIYTSGSVFKDSSIDEFSEYVNDRVLDGVDFPMSINDQTKAFLRNRNLYHSLNNNSLVIGKSGDSELFCGMLIKAEQFGGEINTVNEKLYGNYLVKGIKHKINSEEGYQQVVLLTKPFYNKDVDGVTESLTGRVNK